MKRLAALIALVTAVTFASACMAGEQQKSNDPYRSLQWALDRIKAPAAWEISTGKHVTVAVIDSGVDLTHPDLQDQLIVLPGSDLTDPDGLDGPQDPTGHGTGIAGVIAAKRNNNVGIVGVAPQAKIMPIKVYDETRGAWRGDLFPKAIRFAVDHGADVINTIAWGAAFPREIEEATGFDDLPVPGIRRYLKEMNAAIDYAWERDVLIVASAGNGFPHTEFVYPGYPEIGTGAPACGSAGSNPKVICVGAVDRNDQRAYYSNFDALQGVTYVVGPSGGDVSAGPVPQTVMPCDDRIITTWLRGAERLCPGSVPDGYNSQSGTSESAPHVAGTAALLASMGLNSPQIVDTILTTSDDLGAPGRDSIYGWGRVNANAAVMAAKTK